MAPNSGNDEVQLTNDDVGDQDLEPVMVTMVFDTDDPETLLGILSRYVVVSRTQDGCRNIDMVASTIVPGRLTLVQKWNSVEHQQTHFDSPAMVTMADACTGLLSRPPEIDLHEPVTMHDMR